MHAPTDRPVAAATEMTSTPVAIAEGRAVADALFGPGRPEVDLSRVASAVFLLPPIASVGPTEAALLAAVDGVRPDVVLTDLRMPPTLTDEGMQIAESLRKTHPMVGVVLLSHRQVVEVQRVLGLDLAADVAVAAVHAGALHNTMLVGLVDGVAVVACGRALGVKLRLQLRRMQRGKRQQQARQMTN